ncbi:MAG: hypothetical protein ACRDHY_01700, partial [Anaerolineales bacterium]
MRLTGLTVISCAVLALCAGPAAADTGGIIAPQNNPHTAADGWQAGSCITDAPECSVDTSENFFKQAAGHPNIGFTQFIVKTKKVGIPPLEVDEPVGVLSKVRVDLPTGLSVNPQATPQCETPDNPGACPPDTQVGVSNVTVLLAGVPVPLSAPVFNLVPEQGQP